MAVVDVDCPGATAVLAGDGRSRRRVLAPPTPLLVLATAGTPGTLGRAFQAEARGYVDKDGSPGRLVRAVRKLAAGERFIDASLASAFMEADPVPLSPPALSVLAPAPDGDSVPESARSQHQARRTLRHKKAAE
ncbi:DNA-binding response regulator, partial [Streptomyces sp. NPDC058728]|uniref:DNA-binding response regulator n=1 Tax=Streptomyces sp. NPDC058728 TaxID=3346612 RepID=UPI0036945A3E